MASPWLFVEFLVLYNIMNMNVSSFKDQRIHFVGIKGTGCAALAEILLHKGAKISGSDSATVFYTDQILAHLQIPVCVGFHSDHIPPACTLLIYSAAYDEHNPERMAATKRGIPALSYPQALSLLSEQTFSVAIAGVHGKTTTTSLVGAMIKELSLAGCVLVGSSVAAFGDKSTYYAGDEFFVAETCEYRRHFLHFHPNVVLITSIELDHQDYFKDLAAMEEAFVELGLKLPETGQIIYCADDPVVLRVIETLGEQRPDLLMIPYGEQALGEYQVTHIHSEDGLMTFKLAAVPQVFVLHFPGHHTVLNSAGALAALATLLGASLSQWDEATLETVTVALAKFSGSRRRSEIIGEAKGVLVMDDYAHHPTALRTTLAGFKRFYPQRRLVVSFMSHTYSRTQPLMAEFADSLHDADVLILHKIYASAREKPIDGVSGRTLYDLCATQVGGREIYYVDEPLDSLPLVLELLKEGDLFVTMGAGDNFILSERIYEKLTAMA